MRQVKRATKILFRAGILNHSKRVYTLVAALTLGMPSQIDASEANPYAKAEANARERIALQVAGNCIRSMKTSSLSQQAKDQNREVIKDLEKASTTLLMKLYKDMNRLLEPESIRMDLLRTQRIAYDRYDEMEKQGRTYSSICTEYWQYAAKRVKELINVKYPAGIYTFR